MIRPVVQIIHIADESPRHSPTSPWTPRAHTIPPHPSRIHPIPQPPQPIDLGLSRPNQTSPPPSRPPPTNPIKRQLPHPYHPIRHRPHETRVLLEPPRRPQPPHRVGVVFRADVALRAVLRHDVGEAGGHDEDGEAGRDAPVVVDAVGGVVGVGLEVDEAAAFGPVAGHAVAGLVCAEGSAGVLLAVVLMLRCWGSGTDCAMMM